MPTLQNGVPFAVIVEHCPLNCSTWNTFLERGAKLDIDTIGTIWYNIRCFAVNSGLRNIKIDTKTMKILK